MAEKEPNRITSPKLIDMCQWEGIDEVNKMLDDGDAPLAVFKWINEHGFIISKPLVYDYAKIRKKALVDGINIEHMIGVTGKKVAPKNDPVTISGKNKLKSEIDALDLIISNGYSTLQDWQDRPIPPQTLMAAIKLKNDLTDGNHGFLTNYGMEQLREIEQKKYDLIMQHLISYIPKTRQQEAIDAISDIEENYYKGTDYYEEYLNALDIPEAEKKHKLNLYYQELEGKVNEE